MQRDEERDIDRSAKAWIEHTIRSTHPDEQLVGELAEAFNAIAHERSFPVVVICEWIRYYKGELTTEALRQHIRQVRELQEDLQDLHAPVLCQRCSSPVILLGRDRYCPTCGELVSV